MEAICLTSRAEPHAFFTLPTRLGSDTGTRWRVKSAMEPIPANKWKSCGSGNRQQWHVSQRKGRTGSGSERPRSMGMHIAEPQVPVGGRQLRHLVITREAQVCNHLYPR